MLSLFRCIHIITRTTKRTFLSDSYYCHEAWSRRLSNPLLKSVNLDIMYYELDQRYTRHRQITAIDVDIFVNTVEDETHIDEALDLAHKLRLTAQTGNMLPSTAPAIIRSLLKYKQTESLLSVLDDRMNYGLFLDDFTANLVLDHFWKVNDYVSGARAATLLMLQEDFEHPIARQLALLHCIKFLAGSDPWPTRPAPSEPEDEVKVRVKYVRNPFFDDHFDLREPNHLIGKTLMTATRDSRNDAVDQALFLLGATLYKPDMLPLEPASNVHHSLYEDICKLMPQEHAHYYAPTQKDGLTSSLNDQTAEDVLIERIKKLVTEYTERDITRQIELYSQWEQLRATELDRHRTRLENQKRLAHVEQVQSELKAKEDKLWFFENEEQIELEIEELEQLKEERQRALSLTRSSSKASKSDANYIPPEMPKRQPGAT